MSAWPRRLGSSNEARQRRLQHPEVHMIPPDMVSSSSADDWSRLVGLVMSSMQSSAAENAIGGWCSTLTMLVAAGQALVVRLVLLVALPALDLLRCWLPQYLYGRRCRLLAGCCMLLVTWPLVIGAGCLLVGCRLLTRLMPATAVAGWSAVSRDRTYSRAVGQSALLPRRSTSAHARIRTVHDPTELLDDGFLSRMRVLRRRGRPGPPSPRLVNPTSSTLAVAERSSSVPRRSGLISAASSNQRISMGACRMDSDSDAAPLRPSTVSSSRHRIAEAGSSWPSGPGIVKDSTSSDAS